MEIAAVINTHCDTCLTQDTVESVLSYVTDNVLVIVDAASWECWGKDLEIDVPKISGFYHGVTKAPYRNVALGMNQLIQTYDECEWYVYLESDVLFTSSRFKDNLKMADEKGVWMLGNDGHVDDKEMPLIESLVGGKFKSIYYLIGCCQFFGKKFIDKLRSINFFERFLHLTNNFSPGYFPKYEGYDISEHMYPTLCRHFGGNIGVFATYDYGKLKWHGSYEYFPMRWNPDLNVEEVGPKASIAHPVKKFSHPVRIYHRKVREQMEVIL